MRVFRSIAAACLLAIAFVGLSSVQAQSPGQLEGGINRPGGDYNSMELDQPNPAICQATCFQDSRCRSFTYVLPGVQGPRARCWLKNSVPPPQPNNCCVSGVNPTGPGNNYLEEDTDRYGSDFQRVEMGAPDPWACRTACVNNGACQTFTYVKPGVQGPNPICYLKNAAPAPTPNACCVSGMVRANAPPPPPNYGAGNVAGPWHLTSNCFANPAPWSADIYLNQAPDGSLNGSISNDALHTTMVFPGGQDSWQSTVPNQISGSNFSLLLHPAGWVSVLELTGQLNGDRITGRVHHYTTDDCDFGMTR